MPFAEFLVEIGLDEAAVARFAAGLGRVRGMLAGFGRMVRSIMGGLRQVFSVFSQIAGTALHLVGRAFRYLLETIGLGSAGIIYAIERTITQFTSLYFAARRVGTTVQGLLAVRFAAEQIGLSADAAQSQVESLATSMRLQPGTNFLLNSFFGIRTQGRRPEDILTDLAGRYRQVLASGNQFQIAAFGQILQQLGVDERVLKQMADEYPELIKSQQEYNEYLKEAGLDADKVSENWKNVKQAFGSVKAILDVIWDRVTADLIPSLQEAFGDLTTFLRTHEKEIVAFFDHTIKAIIDWIRNLDWEGIKKNIRETWKVIVSIDWKAVGEAIKEFVGFLWGVVKAFAALYHLATLLANVLNRLAGLPQVAEEQTPTGEDTGTAEAGAPGGPTPAGQPAGEGGLPAPESNWTRIGRSLPLVGGFFKPPGNIPTLKTGPAEQQAMEYFMSQGWSRAQAAGIVANLKAESGLNPQARNPTGHLGIAQWDAARQARFERVMGKPVAQASLAEQLFFVQWELINHYREAAANIKRATDAATAASAMQHGYEILFEQGTEEKRRAWATQLAGMQVAAAAPAPGTAPAPATPAAAAAPAATTDAGHYDPAEDARAAAANAGHYDPAEDRHAALVQNLSRLASATLPLRQPVVVAAAGNQRGDTNITLGGATITVHGSSDPAETGHSVRLALERTNADVIRNLRGALA